MLKNGLLVILEVEGTDATLLVSSFISSMPIRAAASGIGISLDEIWELWFWFYKINYQIISHAIITRFMKITLWFESSSVFFKVKAYVFRFDNLFDDLFNIISLLGIDLFSVLLDPKSIINHSFKIIQLTIWCTNDWI